ncbi:MAG: histidine kinase [Deltaproteobacteria bacterium]|jgi:two-component system sensor histidine kinase CpxA|nr:histidine kinase [Deltaproteobacteria bacterium]
MKPSKIYIKIFFSFLLILIVTEILIFALFGIIMGRYFQSEVDHYASAQVMMVKEIIDGKIRAAPDVELSQNESLKDFIRNWGEALGAQVWLQGSDGQLVAKSFSGDLPKEQSEFQAGQWRDLGTFRMYHGHKKSSRRYAVIPIEVKAGKNAELHVFFAKREPSHPQEGFGLGLVIIGVVIALLVMPVSRLISKPINELRRSAQRIAEGDLSHRATMRRKDEIGKLGRAFNHMADRLEKMIRGGRELTAHMSHELRTPLARIRIAEEMLREKLEQQNYRDLDRYLNEIREDVGELDDLIGRILMLSKLDLKEKPLSFQRVNPVDLMQVLLSRLKPALDQKNLSLTTEFSFEPPLRGDPDALQTTFSNLLENATKYSPSGGRVIVEIKAVGEEMEFLLTNTADKIPQEDLEKIFEPFHRAGAKKEAGFGLGLAIAKKTVEAHGGTIEASNAEEGFRIRIRLPRNPTEEGV